MIGFVADAWPNPMRSSADDPGAEDAERSRQAPITSAIAAAIASVTGKILPGQHPPRSWVMDYFLFIGGSSMKLAHIPLGLTWAAFLMTLIFILLSYATAPATSCASATTADSILGL